MRMKSTMFRISAVAIGVLCLAVAPAADTEAFTMRVSVEVSGKGSTKAEFESYIKRELRGLKDVEVVDNSPNFTFSFVVLETQSKGGTSTGYAISEVVTHRLSQKAFQGMFKNKLSPGDFAWLEKATASAVLIDMHNLQTCAPNELKSVCEKLIAEFDTDMLEPGRKMIRQIQETMDKNQKP